MRHVARLAMASALALASFTATQAAQAEDFLLTSPGVSDGTPLDVKNAGSDLKRSKNCVGQNVSPAFAWSGVPAGTKSLVLLMFDPEGRGGLGVSHWVSYGIDPTKVHGFAEGEVSKDGPKYVGGKSRMGVGHDFGPCTPAGTGYHHYTFTLIATDLAPDALKPGMTREELFPALKGHTKSATGLIRRFKHP